MILIPACVGSEDLDMLVNGGRCSSLFTQGPITNLLPSQASRFITFRSFLGYT